MTNQALPTVRLTAKRKQAIALGLITLQQIQEAAAAGTYIDVQPLLDAHAAGTELPTITENGVEAAPVAAEIVVDETRDQADQRIRESFEILREVSLMAVDGDCRSLVVSGPPGLGKSHITHSVVKSDSTHYKVIKGYAKATGLYRALYECSSEGSVLVLDDCDAILYDENAMNMLKAAVDTDEDRIVSYGADYDMQDEDGETIPKEFSFQGSLVVITNIDFDKAINEGRGRMVPHWEALLSRSHFIDLGIKTVRDYLIRIGHVVEDGALDHMNLSTEAKDEVIDFVFANAEQMRELSVRVMLKVASIRASERVGHDWVRIARATCCRPVRRRAV